MSHQACQESKHGNRATARQARRQKKTNENDKKRKKKKKNKKKKTRADLKKAEKEGTAEARCCVVAFKFTRTASGCRPCQAKAKAQDKLKAIRSKDQDRKAKYRLKQQKKAATAKAREEARGICRLDAQIASREQSPGLHCVKRWRPWRSAPYSRRLCKDRKDSG